MKPDHKAALDLAKHMSGFVAPADWILAACYLDLREKAKASLDALDCINDEVYAQGIRIGTDRYFKVRTLCCNNTAALREILGEEK